MDESLEKQEPAEAHQMIQDVEEANTTEEKNFDTKQLKSGISTTNMALGGPLEENLPGQRKNGKSNSR